MQPKQWLFFVLLLVMMRRMTAMPRMTPVHPHDHRINKKGSH